MDLTIIYICIKICLLHLFFLLLDQIIDQF